MELLNSKLTSDLKGPQLFESLASTKEGRRVLFYDIHTGFLSAKRLRVIVNQTSRKRGFVNTDQAAVLIAAEVLE